MRKLMLVLALIGASALFLSPSSASAAASCHLSVTAYAFGNHPAGQATWDTCTDVDKIEVVFGPASTKFGMRMFPGNGLTATTVFADRFSGINACGTAGWQTVPQPAGTSFICQAGSGTICGSAAAQCSVWGYRSDYSFLCSGSSNSFVTKYRFHRWSTNTWPASYTEVQSPQVPIC